MEEIHSKECTILVKLASKKLSSTLGLFSLNHLPMERIDSF